MIKYLIYVFIIAQSFYIVFFVILYGCLEWENSYCIIDDGRAFSTKVNCTGHNFVTFINDYLLTIINTVGSISFYECNSKTSFDIKKFKSYIKTCQKGKSFSNTTPPRTPRISRLKSQIMKPTFLG